MKRHEIHTKKGWKGHGEKSFRKKAGSDARIKYYFNNHLNRESILLLKEEILSFTLEACHG
jgi:hypothetical protein